MRQVYTSLSVARFRLGAALGNRPFILLLALGFVIRLLLCPYTTASTDLQIYGSVADDGVYGIPLYRNFAFSYPALWGYFFRLAGVMSHAAGVTIARDFPQLAPYSFPGLYTPVNTTPLANFLLKAPAIGADMLAAYFIALLLRDHVGLSLERRRFAVLLWWLNPLVIWVSSIQAGWDSFVACSIAAALYYAFSQRWTTCGAILGLGIMAKVVPILSIVPLAFWAYKSLGSWGQRSSAILRLLVGIILIISILMIPILAWQERNALGIAVFARGQQFLIEGLNLAAFIWIKPLNWVFAVANANRAIIVQVLSRLQLAVFALLIARAFFAKRFDKTAAMLMTLCLFLVLFILSPYVQPNYILWVLPVLIALSEVVDKSYRSYALLLSVLAVVYIASVRALPAIFLPACLYLYVCDAVHFASAAYRYNVLTPGLFSMSPQVDINAVLGEIGAIIIFVLGIRAIVRYWKQCGEWYAGAYQTQAPISILRDSPGLIWMVSAASALVAAQFLSFPFPTAAAERGAGRLSVDIHGYRGEANLITSLVPLPQIRQVFLFDDSAYVRGRGGSQSFAWAFKLHFQDQLSKHHMRIDFQIVDAGRLKRILVENPAGRALLILEGFLPNTVRSKHRDLLRGWVRRGGLVVWAGAPFDAFYSTRGSSRMAARLRGPYFKTWPELFGGSQPVMSHVTDPWSPPLHIAGSMSAWWNINRFDNDRATFPVYSRALQSAGGTPLGFISDEGYSAVSQLPFKKGRIVFFGDAFADEAQAAYNVAQLLYSGSWYEPRRLSVSTLDIEPGYDRYVVASEQARSWRLYAVPPAFQSIGVGNGSETSRGKCCKSSATTVLQTNWPQALPSQQQLGPILDSDSLATEWERDTGLALQGNPAYSSGLVVFCTGNHLVAAFSARNGERVWSYLLGNGASATPLVYDGEVITGIGDGFYGGHSRHARRGDSALYSFDLNTGTVRWYVPLQGPALAPGAIVAGRLYVFDGSGRISDINARSGHLLAQWHVPWKNFGAPLLGASANAIVGTASSGKVVFSFDGTAGRVAWQHHTRQGTLIQAAVANPRVTVVFARARQGRRWRVLGYRSLDGSILWKRDYGSRIDGWPMAAMAEGRVFIATPGPDASIRALDANTGAQLWIVKMPSGSPGALAIHNNELLAEGTRGRLFSFAAASGTITGVTQSSVPLADYAPIVVGHSAFLTGRDGGIAAVRFR